MRKLAHSARILVVDDEKAIGDILARGIQRDGYTCATAGSAEQALVMLADSPYDLVVTDIGLPGMSGLELCAKVRHEHAADVIVMTGLALDYPYEEIIAHGASDFIHKPLRLPEFMARVRRVLWERETVVERNQALREARKSVDMLRQAVEGIVVALSRAVEIKDPYTAGHQLRVAELACSIARAMGLSEERVAGLRIASIIHDLGKITVPMEILNKPGRLSALETEFVRTHVLAGCDILGSIEFPWPVLEIIRQHHERLDGSGYPDGLTGDDIMLEARILSVADVFETMSSHRPYRPARGVEAASEELTDHAGEIYDSEVVAACLRVASSQAHADGALNANAHLS